MDNTSSNGTASIVVLVTTDQCESALALVRISRGLDKVDPLIAKIATAPPATPEQKRLAKRC